MVFTINILDLTAQTNLSAFWPPDVDVVADGDPRLGAGAGVSHIY